MRKAKPSVSRIVLQERDHALLRGLFESRCMTPAHAAALCFDGRGEATKKRLQKLKAAGYIAERRRRPFEPSVLSLTREGLDLLRQRGVLAEYPPIDLPALATRTRVSELTLRHELEVMDVKAALHTALRNNPTFSIKEFSTWPLLYQFEASRLGPNGSDVTVKPDGFVRLHEQEPDGGLSEHTFFLEVDRSSETLDTLVARAGCYFNYYRSGGFAVRNGASPSDFKDFPFRVLFVFKTAERRNNTIERLLQATVPVLTQAWLTTRAEALANPLGPIWIRPADYRQAVAGTPFEPNSRHEQWGYQRQTAREVFVESKVSKLRLLED